MTSAWAKAPADATAQCKDGTYYSGASRQGACSGHGGIKDWYGEKAAAPAPAAKAAPKGKEAAPPKAESAKGKEAAAPKADAAKGKEAAVPKADAAKTKAAAPTKAEAPADATAQCKDGTFYSGASRQGACSGHGGIKDWYGEKAAAPAPAPAKPERVQKPAPAAPAPATAAPAPAAPAPAAPPPAPAKPAAVPAPAPMPAPAPARPATPAPAKAPAGSAPVWVNKDSKIYHCQGDRWYGTTKNGEYMSRAQADAQGMTAAKGKYCEQ